MTVYIVEDHRIIYEGLKHLLETENIKVLGYGRNGTEAIKWLNNNNVDVVITDFRMSGMDGADFIEYLSNNDIQQNILVVSAYTSHKEITYCIEKGAKGYVSKEEASLYVVKALKAVNKGVLFFSPNVKKEIISYRLKNEDDDKPESFSEKLSDQQSVILSLILKGYSDEEISNFIEISISTLRTHKQRMREKFNVKTTIGLVKLALQNNFN